MKVRALHQIAYNNNLYAGGDVFELPSQLFDTYKNDVEIISKKDTPELPKTIKVRALHQIAYKNTLYNGGDIFEIEEKDMKIYLLDVEIVKIQKIKKK